MRDEVITAEACLSQPAPGVLIKLTDPNRPECLTLFQHLWEELGQLYGDTGPCQFSPADVEGAGAALLVAWLAGEPVGCGAIRPLVAEVAEVKRMFVEERARRRGVARSILRELESIAGELGYSVMRLETGVRQPEAMRLYESEGFRRIECYAPYGSDPISVCFEKQLGAARTER